MLTKGQKKRKEKQIKILKNIKTCLTLAAALTLGLIFCKAAEQETNKGLDYPAIAEGYSSGELFDDSFYQNSSYDTVMNDNGSNHYSSDGKLDINKATIEELCTLKGIGEKRAESIIKYREDNGGFKSINELMNVSGIKDGIFNGIKGNIFVNK